MKCIVPLAGPDLWTPDYGFRPMMPFEGATLIEQALKPRVWAKRLASDDYIFVLRQVEGLEELTAYLAATWPGSKTVVLSALTGGALYSVQAGVALLRPDEPVIVDLADILFTDGPDDPQGLLKTYDMAVPVFISDDPIYSYLRLEDGAVVEAREKEAISDKASAGVYMFKDMQTYLRAAAHSIDERETLSYRGVLFICPMVNGVIANGGMVAAPLIETCRPVGKMFHD